MAKTFVPLAYVVTARIKNRGYCECGWAGRRRLFRGSAVVEVLEHCAATGHYPRVTLGVPQP